MRHPNLYDQPYFQAAAVNCSREPARGPEPSLYPKRPRAGSLTNGIVKIRVRHCKCRLPSTILWTRS